MSHMTMMGAAVISIGSLGALLASFVTAARPSRMAVPARVRRKRPAHLGH